MAEADISRDMFRDTVVTTTPKMEKNRTITRSRERPLGPFCLFGLVMIGPLLSGGPAASAAQCR